MRNTQFLIETGRITLADVLGVFYIVISVASVLILRVALSNRDKTGSDEFALLVLGILVMGSATGVQFIADSYRWSVTAWNVLILGADIISVGLLLFAVESTNWRAIPRYVLALLGLEIAVVQAFAWTNPSHHLVLLPDSAVDAQGFHHEVYGPVFWGHATIAYVLIFVSFALILREFLDSTSLRREQLGLILGSLSVPLVLNVLYVFRLQPIDITFTPIGFFVAELGFGWALYHVGFLDVVPVARRVAIQEMGGAFITVDDENRVVDYNDAAMDLFNVEGRPKGIQAPEFFGPSSEIMEQFDDVTDTETEIALTRGGERRHYHLSVSPVRGGVESGTSHVIVLSDITPLKRREQELEQTTERLDRFASVVSHDLRNPLNVAQGRVEFVQQDADSEHLAAAGRALDRIEEIITGMLTLARQGQSITDLKEVQLSVISTRAWDVVDAREATLTVEGDSTFLADANRTQQLLENLFRNAVDHGRDDIAIRAGALENGDGFYVEDDGPGIPRRIQSHVFEGGYSTDDSGTGFGLAIVEEIVESHGWSVNAVDSDDGGARFEITGTRSLS